MPDASLAGMGLRLAISMGVVIALMFLAAKLLRRAQAFAAKSGTRSGGRVSRIPIAVSTIAPLTRGASVAIVRAAGRELVVGITEQQVTLLHSALETRDELGGHDGAASPDTLDDSSLVLAEDGLLDLDRLDGATSTRSPLTGAARIAALVPTLTASSGDDGGSSAWTDALETLRARTVRR